MYVNQRANTAVCVFEQAASNTVSVLITILESFARPSVSSLSAVPRPWTFSVLVTVVYIYCANIVSKCSAENIDTIIVNKAFVSAKCS